MYKMCPQCELAIRDTEHYHCGDCGCCRKISAVLRGDEATHPAAVSQAICHIQAELGSGDELTIKYDDQEAPRIITDRLRAGHWRGVIIRPKSELWYL